MSVFFAPSIWRSMDPRTASSVLASIISNPTGEHVIWQPLWNDALIARSRSLLATQFLESDADVMVIVDDDIVWNPSDFWKLVDGARETHSIYCGPYVTRSDRPHLASRMFPASGVEIYASTHRRPIEIEYAATGFVAIHRDVLEAMLGQSFHDADGEHRIHKVSKGGNVPFWPFFSTFTICDASGEYHYLSEDWAFSERARQCGFKVWMDQSIILQHMGWYPFTIADLNRPDESPLPSTGTDTVEVAGAVRETGDPLIDSLVDDIAEWAHELPGDIRRDMAGATAKLAELWNTRTEDEAEWYLREDVGLAYILDLAQWHTSGGGVPCSHAAPLARQRVLDWGAGIGTFALQAAREGAVVTAWEPNDTLREFASWRATKHGLAENISFPCRSPKGGWFDAAVCWHVFEHVENAEDLAMHLWSRLRSDGLLITQSDFDQHDSHPMHHVRQDWEDVLALNFQRTGPDTYRMERFE